MKPRLILISCVFILGSLSDGLIRPSEANSERRFGWRLLRRRPLIEAMPPKRSEPIRTTPHRRSVYDFYHQFYPRYYGGFHARFLYEYGLPPGDIGIRGTPW